MRNPMHSDLSEFNNDEFIPSGYSGNCRSAIEQLRSEVIDIGTHILTYMDQQRKNPNVDKSVMLNAKTTLDALDLKVQLIKKRMRREQEGFM